MFGQIGNDFMYITSQFSSLDYHRSRDVLSGVSSCPSVSVPPSRFSSSIRRTSQFNNRYRYWFSAWISSTANTDADYRPFDSSNIDACHSEAANIRNRPNFHHLCTWTANRGDAWWNKDGKSIPSRCPG